MTALWSCRVLAYSGILLFSIAKTVHRTLNRYWPPHFHLTTLEVPPIIIKCLLCMLQHLPCLLLSFQGTQLAGSSRTSHRDDCLKHCVHGILRARARPFTHSPTVASGVMEYRNMHVHGLDSIWLPRLLRGLYRVEWECH